MRILALVLGFALLLSMGIGGAAHANERICDGTEEVQRDRPSEKSSGDDTKAAHVHGCHGHHFATPTATGENIIFLSSGGRLSMHSALCLPSLRAGPELRPPQA